MVNHAACLASTQIPSSRLYITGGIDSTNSAMNKFQIYDLLAEQWMNGTDMLHARESHGCIVMNDTLWIMGYIHAIHKIQCSTTVIDSISWEKPGRLPVSDLISFGVAAYEDLIFVVGGKRDNTVESTMYIIDTSDGSVQFEAMGFAVHSMPAVVVDNIICGYGGVEFREYIGCSDSSVHYIFSLYIRTADTVTTP